MILSITVQGVVVVGVGIGIVHKLTCKLGAWISRDQTRDLLFISFTTHLVEIVLITEQVPWQDGFHDI